ncbi:MAG: hypothetical protein OXD31_17160 [Chloroflexi bacterium]|nr:hypothetical protein [Chloroflexota bacterium]
MSDNTLAKMVERGEIATATPRPDADSLEHVVEGCFACGGPESAMHSFTTYYRKDDGKLDGCWLCKPCTRLIFNLNDPGEVLFTLSTEDILARNPELRQAYIEGRITRTADYPAGFVLKGELP